MIIFEVGLIYLLLTFFQFTFSLYLALLSLLMLQNLLQHIFLQNTSDELHPQICETKKLTSV